jgi:hypothetical protein
MLKQRLLWVVCWTAIAIPFGSVSADPPTGAHPTAKAGTDTTANTDAKLAEKNAKAAATTETVDQLVEQLDSADFAKREAACGKLAGKGKEAIPALEKAANKGDLEVCSRAIGVLGKLLKSSDDKTSKAAEASLQRLADGDSPSASRKAKSILDKKNGVAENNIPFGPNGFGGGGRFGGGIGGGRIIINGGMLQIGGGGAVKSLSVSNNNGVREIKATEGDKTVKIADDPTNGIKIECTDKVNGKEVTKKYEAKSADDLKKNQPEGYKLYKEYEGQQGNGGAVQLQLQAVPAMPALPMQPAIPRRPRAFVPAADNDTQLDMATRRLKNMSAQLESLRNFEALKSASDERKAEFKKQVDELSKRIDELRKQLDKK